MKGLFLMLSGCECRCRVGFCDSYAEEKGIEDGWFRLPSSLDSLYLSQNGATGPPAQNVRPGEPVFRRCFGSCREYLQGPEVCLKSSRPSTWRFRNWCPNGSKDIP